MYPRRKFRNVNELSKFKIKNKTLKDKKKKNNAKTKLENMKQK